MTDSPTLRDAIERDFDMTLDDFEDFSDDDVAETLMEFARNTNDKFGNPYSEKANNIFFKNSEDFIDNFRDNSPKFRSIVNEWQNKTQGELIQIRKDIRTRIETATDEEIRSRALTDLRKVNSRSYGQYLTVQKLRGKRAFRQSFERLERG